ncbi:ABC transporter permease [Runella sp.]|uniref:ABC transporter permease n=1 Tax=Runella sp. TaxID=1960881 RepID=UPI003D0A1356
MLRNYFKIALRSLWRHKLYSSINILGLAVGLAACLLMSLYVRHELTYDGFHKHADRIVRITSFLKTPEDPIVVAGTPALLASFLNRDYPEVEKAVRFHSIAATIQQKNKLFNEDDVFYADQAIFEVFSYPLVVGNMNRALTQPNTAVITEALAKKYFGHNNVVGQTLKINKVLYQITGVLAPLPSNTDLKINALLSHDFSKVKTWIMDDISTFTYVLLRRETNLKAFEKNLNVLSQRYIQPELKQMGDEGYSLEFQTESLNDVHYSQGKLDDTPKGDKQYSYLFSFLAAFVLVIALLNYISLLTARATERAKEVGIRKANGAFRAQLIRQFLFESLLISTLSVVFSVLLLQIAIPILNDLLAIKLQTTLLEISIWIVLGLGITTLLGGLYPAFIVSAFRPAEALRGSVIGTGKAVWLRQSITVFQFVLAVGMIVGVLVIYRQMDFLQTHSPGFDKNHVLTVQLPADSLAKTKGYALAATLRQYPQIQDITVSSGLEPASIGPAIFTSTGKRREIMVYYSFIDEHYVPLLGMKIIAGRNLMLSNTSDKKGGFLINEAFVKMSGWKQPLGQSMEGFGKKGKVIGVVKNFHYRSLHNLVKPLVMAYNSTPPNNLMLKTKAEHLAMVKKVWQQHFPYDPFEYSFLDTTIEEQYEKDRLMMVLFNAFAFLTILVSSLGLFSLVTFTTEIRTKEIGIRKVLGASVAGITALLSKDFLKLVMIAIVIASPLAYYAMNLWLQNFAYHIEINWWMFVVAAILAVFIAIATISFQSIKAALMNPVKSLKSE